MAITGIANTKYLNRF